MARRRYLVDDEMTPMDGMFFNGWFALLRTAVVGILAYAALLVFLRLGKAHPGEDDACDLIVTVSLGSTLATIALSADVALAQGLLALALLVALQFMIKRIALWCRLIRCVPTLH